MRSHPGRATSQGGLRDVAQDESDLSGFANKFKTKFSIARRRSPPAH
jgi:hypothetical protein